MLPRRESSDFSLFSPNRRPRLSRVVHSFYSVLFSAPRRLLIRQRIEEEARCHTNASTETVKLPALFLTFRRVLAVNQRRVGTRNSSKIHPGAVQERERERELKKFRRQKRHVESYFSSTYLAPIANIRWRVYRARLMRFPTCKKHKARTRAEADPKQPRFDIRLLQVSVDPLHPRLN